MKNKPELIFFFILFFLILSGGILFLSGKPNNLLKQKRLERIGFLPYWNITEDLEIDFDMIDQLIYFSLLVNEDGEFDQTDGGWIFYQDGRIDDLLAKAREKGKKSIICIASFDANVMHQTTLNPKIREKLIDNIILATKEKNFDGVDIDFEYFWKYYQDESFGKNFNIFLKELRTKMDQINPNLTLSVDIYPKAIIENHPYELEELTAIVDQVIIMAYDYTQSNSDQAGPIAPIDSEPESIFKLKENFSIKQTVDSALKVADSKKWVLGIPLYGYKWQTIDDQYRSQAINYGRAKTIQYGQTKELINEKNPQLNWNNASESPWLIYKDAGIIYQLYYENLESLKAKFDLAKESKLPAIAFWALGYEGKEKDFWECLQ